MSKNLERLEGRVVDGRFPLQSYLGGSDHSAVYLTVARVDGENPEKAAIKLIPADTADAEAQRLRWNAVAELKHPNLIRVFEAGRCELEGTALLYVVEEYAEENLAQILPERALTAEEARALLPPVLRALQFVHSRDFVHGHIQPSNILAIGDQVKLSSDTLGVAGEKIRVTRAASAYDPPEAEAAATSTASDVWQLGTTVIEALSGHFPGSDRVREPGALPEPFREIAEHCLQVDAEKRWTVTQILGRLEPDRPVPARAQAETIASASAVPTLPEKSAKWPYWLALAAVGVFAFFLLMRAKPSSPAREVPTTQARPAATSENAQPANSPSGPLPAETKPQPSPAASTQGEAKVGNRKAGTAHESDVLRRVTPQVSPSARRTIQGTIKVRLKAEVDAAGNVTETKFESAGPSKYFSRIAMDAAREWKFAPAQAGESASREWKLQFAFSRARTEVSAVRAKP
jgi:TonB family protein